MSESSKQAKAIFLAAIERKPEEWPAFLDQACAGDAELRAEAEKLLQAQVEMGSFHEPPRPTMVPTIDQPLSERPGTIIGQYKLLEQIGEGGFGVVFMAEQIQPVRRKVALKVLKPGMDSRQVVARFEAERQALAIMDHPNIAKVLDGGATASGRPYFVMELVKGMPLTEFCDQNHLMPRQRLELFVSVCQAVQHAHQKGVIHRDLKPSNVLVTVHDTRPVAKVIDFGVAKALGQELTDKTLFTGFAQMIGTPLYMSPEQAGESGLDIDTRSDIYSLGVMLYELLTGTTPFDKERFKRAAFQEIRRIIREEEPPRPSTRLSELGRSGERVGRPLRPSHKDAPTSSLASISAQRQTEPATLAKLVRGDLDWIVMKALEKDRNRRYETANSFALDVQRYLADEPVFACPPSALYRLRKFGRRNKARLLVVGSILFLLLLLGAGGGWIALDRAAQRGKANQDVDLALQAAELYLGQAKQADARAALDQAERLASEIPAASLRHGRLAALKQRLQAEELDERFVVGYEKIRLNVETQIDVRENRFNREAGSPALRKLFGEFGIRFAEMPVEQAAARIRNRPESVRHQLIAALYYCDARTPNKDARTREWLGALLEAADTDTWRTDARKAAAARDWKRVEQLLRAVDVTTQPASSLIQVAEVLPADRKATRLELLRRIRRAYPADVWANHDLGMELVDNGRHAEAIRYLTAALALRPESPGLCVNRGVCLQQIKEMDEAIADFRRCLTLAPNYFTAFANLSVALQTQGKWQEALAVCNQAVQVLPDRAGAWSNRAVVYNHLGEPEKAIADCERAIKLDEKLGAAWSNRGAAHRIIGQYEKAISDCTRALQLDDKNAGALATRGNCYFQRDEHSKALADLSRSIDLDLLNAFAWYSRGRVHEALGDSAKAVADCQRAVDLGPKDPWAHGNLGDVLLNTNRTKEASVAYRKAIAIDKLSPEFHAMLGMTLRQQGDFREALAEMRRAHKLPSKRPDWPAQATEWVRQCERLVELDERLPAFFSGKNKPATPEEGIELAELCVRKQLHRAAVRFYDGAFTPVSPRTAPLIGVHRYNAACAAVLAGCGQGKDAAQLTHKERSQLRRQALDWMRGSLDTVGRLLDKTPEKAPALVRSLEFWLADSDFAGVRGPKAQAKLSEAERTDWQKLWNDIADMLRQAQGKSRSRKK